MRKTLSINAQAPETQVQYCRLTFDKTILRTI